MSWVCGILGGLWLLATVRLRARLGALNTLQAPDEAADPEHRFVVAPGGSLPASTRQAASAFARAEGLEVLDLVPGDLPTSMLFALGSAIDPRRYRSDHLAPGMSAGHAVCVHRSLLDRAGLESFQPRSAADLYRLVVKLKRLAPLTTDLAVVPGKTRGRIPAGQRVEYVRELLHHRLPWLLPSLFGLQLAAFALVVVGVVLAPVWGLCALGAFHLQPLLASLKGPVRPRDVWVYLVFRMPLELGSWCLIVFGTPRTCRDEVESLRPKYARMLEDGGLESFFQPRRLDCPLCLGQDLALAVRMPDLHQHKPGRFSLERCRTCGHIFQNPRLSTQGLDYYYRDFYDGLGERKLDFLFAGQTQVYLDRARTVPNDARAGRWLDVGAGHGHFCLAAKEVWPRTRFDGLDLAASIEEAARRGWIEQAYRGLFPELSSQLTGQYDVVSMNHYLEHTLSPRDEIAAAREVLGAEGILLIELPNPDSAFRSLLGRFWMPYFQPQHLHLVNAANLERLLAEQGFTPLVWVRGENRSPTTWILSVLLLLERLGPEPLLPWRKTSALAGLRRTLVWLAGTPLLVLALVLDRLSRPLVRRPRWSNIFRVAARKDPHPGKAPEESPDSPDTATTPAG